MEKEMINTGTTFNDFLKKETNNLDLIRLLLAIFVIYSHALVISPPAHSGNHEFLIKITGLNYVSFGGVAVKTFFLISGMLVTSSILDNRNILKYITSRFFRIIPAFVVTVILSSFLASLLSTDGMMKYFKSPILYDYISNTLKMDIRYYLPGVFENNPYKAFNGSLWSIPLEIKCYLYLLYIYIISSIVPKGRVILMIFSLLIIIEPFLHISRHLIKTDNPDIYLLYPFFSIGVLLATLKEKLKVSCFPSLACISLLFYFLSGSQSIKIAMINITFSLLLIYLSSLSFFIKQIRMKYDISYGVYLWAFPIQQAIELLLKKDAITNFVFSLLLSVIFGVISFKYIECPFINIGRKLNIKWALMFNKL
jgi:peptidoglycan/LPS O-acetylase OafA/YrhL